MHAESRRAEHARSRRAVLVPSLLAGVVISTIPFWGPNLDPDMKMRLDWIGTILAHYVAGAMVLLGGVLQLRALVSGRSEALLG